MCKSIVDLTSGGMKVEHVKTLKNKASATDAKLAKLELYIENHEVLIRNKNNVHSITSIRDKQDSQAGLFLTTSRKPLKHRIPIRVKKIDSELVHNPPYTIA